MGATPSGLISDPSPNISPHFVTDALPAAILPLYPGLGQASNMLACIHSGVVYVGIIMMMIIVVMMMMIIIISVLP